MKEASRKGMLIFEKGKYFLEVEGERQELPPGMGIDEAQLRDLAGKEVEVLYSEPKRFAIALLGPRMPPIICYLPPWPPEPWPGPTCYLPVPWLIKGVEKEVRANLAKRFLDEGLINREVYDKLV
ncbi:MAG TPA: hypothetical protein VMW58_12575 [Anaerolineae bacterium]|nr:hypothetical protein [Anaerolineae bacterium]